MNENISINLGCFFIFFIPPLLIFYFISTVVPNQDLNQFSKKNPYNFRAHAARNREIFYVLVMTYMVMLTIIDIWFKEGPSKMLLIVPRVIYFFLFAYALFLKSGAETVGTWARKMHQKQELLSGRLISRYFLSKEGYDKLCLLLTFIYVAGYLTIIRWVE